MRVCTFTLRGEKPEKARLGSIVDGELIEPGVRLTMQQALEGGAGTLKLLGRGTKKPLSDVRLSAPLPRPKKILATIVNTRGMLGGSDATLDRPRVDMKAPSTVVGPDHQILAPEGGVRPEVELAVIIGEQVTRADVKRAKDAIFGYTILNDVTSPKDSRDDAYEAYRRDRQTGEIRKVTLRGPLFRSKNHDTFCPMGPWIVTADELPKTSNLRMTTSFNGMTVQDGNTSEYLFAPETIVSYLSGFLTLEPGDVVSCGSVGWTKEAIGELDASEYVLPSTKGTLKLTIEGIGTLSNPVTGV